MCFFSISILFILDRNADNPYNCSCETQSLWNWVRNHQKILQSSERHIQCESPAVLRGRPFSQVTAEEFCPLITHVSVDDVQPYSVSVSWENREHSGLSGFEIFYQAIDGGIDDVSERHNVRFLYFTYILFADFTREFVHFSPAPAGSVAAVTFE